MSRLRFAILLAAVLGAACGSPPAGPDGGGTGADAGGRDAGLTDAGGTATDAGWGDGGIADAGSGDAGDLDGGGVVSDAGTVDGGSLGDGGSDGGSTNDGGALTDGGTLQTLLLSPETPEDVVSSYLMQELPPAWNLFHGDTVPLGRRETVGTGVSYHTAIRFPGVALPPGAVIERAELSFHGTNEVDSSKSLLLFIHAEASADSPAFDPTSYDSGRPDQRPLTSALIDRWVVRCNSSCTDLTEYDCPQRMLDCWDREVRYACPKDLGTLVQEVVDLPGWASGNALTLILHNAAGEQDTRYRESRSITGVDPARGPGYRPELLIEWR